MWIARGPRAVEAELLARVAALAAEARREPRRLALPVRIVVPSRSLADHVGERLVAHAGHALAGVLVQTLHGLALEVLERAGARRTGQRRACSRCSCAGWRREEPLLRERLGALVDGYAAVEASVADLLDAGFDEGSAEAVLEALRCRRHERDHARRARSRWRAWRVVVSRRWSAAASGSARCCCGRPAKRSRATRRRRFRRAPSSCTASRTRPVCAPS